MLANLSRSLSPEARGMGLNDFIPLVFAIFLTPLANSPGA
jgi:hypothetical protein